MPDKSSHTMSDLSARAEAFLLAEGGPVSLRKLAQLLNTDVSAAHSALQEITSALTGTGITLVQTDSEVSLSTAPEMSEALRKAFEDTLSREVGSAALEVVAIVLYRGPSTRARIDYIRGVNTSSTIRLLLSRGLLERIPNPDDAREYLYRPTTDLLAHLGVRGASELPEYATIRTELENFEKAQNAFNHDSDIAAAPENT